MAAIRVPTHSRSHSHTHNYTHNYTHTTTHTSCAHSHPSLTHPHPLHTSHIITSHITYILTHLAHFHTITPSLTPSHTSVIVIVHSRFERKPLRLSIAGSDTPWQVCIYMRICICVHMCGYVDDVRRRHQCDVCVCTVSPRILNHFIIRSK